MSQPVSLAFKYTPAEHASAVRLYYARKYGTARSVAVAIVLMGLGAFLGIAGQGHIWWIIAGGGALLLCLIATATIIRPAIDFRREPGLHGEYRFEFSEDGIGFRTAHIDSKLEWNVYREVVENRQLFLLFHGRRAFSIIPKRAFASPEEESAFRDLLIRKITPSRG
jgi:hypothetical protein